MSTTTTVPSSRAAGAETRLIPVRGIVRDIGLLLTRVLLGVVLIAHGWEKLVTNGAGATGQFFDSVGVPAAQAAAVFAGVVELAGGILLVLGLLTQVVAALVVVVMVGAYVFVHQGAGIYATNGGWELVAVIALAVAVFGLVGTGRYSLDALIANRRAARG
ncbi:MULTISPECIES: DoxX family protein [Dietzia]|uniref:DoxX family protein n=1 Tax=Dietzia cercidiphylli TaxID=498199 RepID=A0ABP4VB67_9ACTN|nr:MULTISPECIES: DoxX family membrane protein [Dietzia]MBB1048343.1 DoxX family membrane protein [Dietzia cercidiphylli]MBB1051360.1 DoxX family membrane protein [Dietzia sp. CW19]MCT1514101.1 DoxX family membrane protein [Dietzia cercidiphylli]